MLAAIRKSALCCLTNPFSPASYTRQSLCFFSVSYRYLEAAELSDEENVEAARKLRIAAYQREWRRGAKEKDPAIFQRRCYEQALRNPQLPELMRQYTEKNRERLSALQREKYQTSSITKSRVRLYCWVVKHGWVQNLTWPTHKPVVYSQSTTNHCTGCRYTKRRGSKLWWKRRDEPEQFDCPTCFVKNWPYMPIGYEDLDFGSQIVNNGKRRDRKPRDVSEELIASTIAAYKEKKGDGNS